MTPPLPLRLRLAQIIAGKPIQLTTVTARVDNSPGWSKLGNWQYERTHGEIQQLYMNALDAWRKNPMAKRSIDITTNYTIGTGITITSTIPHLAQFIDSFWHHPKNRLTHRLESISNELALAGDIFPLLFRDSAGMSYLRFTTKERILEIHTEPNDWETETHYSELPLTPLTLTPITRHSPHHPDAPNQNAVMLHYSVNRPLGALTGESDLATVIPWLLRYSRMLEDRVRLHWALRAFLWFIKVPPHMVDAKRSQYTAPPEGGSVIVHDAAEEWTVQAPTINAADASHDMEAVRRMLYTHPPHWYGEPGQSRAEASAMQLPAERALKRRQDTLIFILCDILHCAYTRAHELLPNQYPALPTTNYTQLFTIQRPDITTDDNLQLAQAAKEIGLAYQYMALGDLPRSRKMLSVFLDLVFKTLNEPKTASEITALTDDLFHTIENLPPQTINA